MRLLAALRLRVKDIGLEPREPLVRDGKGGKDRVTVLPENLIASLPQRLAHARALHQQDLAEGFDEVWLPDALAVKYPVMPRAWGWQWVFPSAVQSADPRSGVVRRHHLLQAGYAICTVQELLGHPDMSTTWVYTMCSTVAAAASATRRIRCRAGLAAVATRPHTAASRRDRVSDTTHTDGLHWPGRAAVELASLVHEAVRRQAQ